MQNVIIVSNPKKHEVIGVFASTTDILNYFDAYEDAGWLYAAVKIDDGDKSFTFERTRGEIYELRVLQVHGSGYRDEIPEISDADLARTIKASGFTTLDGGLQLKHHSGALLCQVEQRLLLEIVKSIKPEITREQIPATVRDMLNASVRMGLIDAVGLSVLVAKHGENHGAMLLELDDVAESMRLAGDTGPAGSWAALRCAVVWLLELDAPASSGAERFEFRAQTRPKMLATVERWAVRV